MSRPQGQHIPDELRMELSRLLIMGRGIRRIAAELGINHKTVMAHRDRLKASGELPERCVCGLPLHHTWHCEWRFRTSAAVRAQTMAALAKTPNYRNRKRAEPERYPNGVIKRTKASQARI